MSGQVAVVVGGGSGMGAAAARKLADNGFEVAVLSSSGKGEALGKALGGIGVTGSNQSSEDLAATIAFLASADAAYITGQNIRVDGGLMRSL